MLLIWPHFRTTDACLARLNRCESEGRNGCCGVRILSLEDKSSGESVLPRRVSGELRAAGGVRILPQEDKSSGESVLPRWVSGELRAAGGVRIGE